MRLDVVERDAVRHAQQQVFDARQRAARLGGQHVGVRGHGAPAERLDGTALEQFQGQRPSAVGVGSVEEEEDADGQPVLGAQAAGRGREETARFFLEEGLRQLAGQAGTVAAAATDAAAVLDVFQAQQRFFHDLVRRFSLASGNAPDAAGVTAHFVGVQQLARANNRPAVLHRGVTPG